MKTEQPDFYFQQQTRDNNKKPNIGYPTKVTKLTFNITPVEYVDEMITPKFR